MKTLQRLFNFAALTCFLTLGAVVVGLAQTLDLFAEVKAEVVSSQPIYRDPTITFENAIPKHPVFLAQIEFPVGAQTNGVPDVSTSPLPSSTSDFWTYGIAIVVPLIVGGMKKLLPIIPKWALPVSTPFVGLALGGLLKWMGTLDLPWMDLAKAGMMASFVRESWSQLVTTPLKGEEGAKTKGPEDVATPDFRKKGRQ